MNNRAFSIGKVLSQNFGQAFSEIFPGVKELKRAYWELNQLELKIGSSSISGFMPAGLVEPLSGEGFFWEFCHFDSICLELNQNQRLTPSSDGRNYLISDEVCQLLQANSNCDKLD